MENISLQQSEETASNDIHQNNESYEQFDNVANDASVLSNDSIKVSLATESNGLSLNQLTRKDNVLQSTDNKEVCTKEAIQCKGIKIVSKIKSNTCNKVNNVHEAKAKNITDEEISSDLLKQLCNNKNLIVTKVKSTDDSIEQILDKINNTHAAEAIFPDLAKLLETTNVKFSNHTNAATIKNEANKNRNVNPVDSMTSNDLPDIHNINDQTTKCLQEFDKILAEVQEKDNSDKADALSLGIGDIILDIDKDILNINDIFDDEVLDVDSTYFFQEINHIPNVDKKDFKVTPHSVTVSTTKNNNKKICKTETEDTDIISISSDDNLNTIKNNSTAVENTKNNGSENNENELKINLKSDQKNEFLQQDNNIDESKELKKSEETKASQETKDFEVAKSSTGLIKRPKKTKNSKQTEESEEIRPQAIFDTISISSDEDIETISLGSSKHESDDCGYHSSDFEFISEEEAKKDGFIINLVFERQNLSRAKVGSNIRTLNTTQNDPYGPGPSRNSGNNIPSRTEEKVTSNKNYQENFVMPQEQENQMVNMFQAMPAIPPILYSENKSVLSRARYAGLGFEMSVAMHRLERDDNIEFRDEAQETRNKILEMYPAENALRKLGKRRRR